MPPKLAKSKQLLITILKFKRAKSTYLIPIDLSGKSSQTIKYWTTTLSDVIEQSGGIHLVEDEANEVEDIEIPKSEFIDEEDDQIEVPKSEFAENIDEEADDNKVFKIAPEDIRIAVPKDKSSPYANDWIELSKDSDLSSLVFNDYDIIAFAYLEEPFNVVEAAYDEQQ